MRAEVYFAALLVMLVLGFLLGEAYGRRQERSVRERMRRISAEQIADTIARMMARERAPW
jgi:hypothetical protein